MRRGGRPRLLGFVAASALVGLALAGCSQGGEGSTAGDAAAVREPTGHAAGSAAHDRTEARRTTVSTRAVIRHGEISVVANDMDRARDAVDAVLGRLGGYLASEDTVNDRTGAPERSILVLRVPEPAFDEAMDRLTAIGRALSATRSSEDVTDEVIDVDARVTTQRASIARLQRFLRQATRVEDLVRVESEIATRQAELESLEAQQSYLRDQTSLATITVRLHAPDAPLAVTKPDTGFMAGLSAGWTALKTVLGGAATVAGAVVPFALAAALVAVPAWLLLRAARRRRTPGTPPPAAEAG